MKLENPTNKPEITPFFPAISKGFTSISSKIFNKTSSLANDDTVLMLVNESL